MEQTEEIIRETSSYFSCSGGASEGDFGDRGICAENLPDCWSLLSGAGNHIQHPRRDPRLLRQLHTEKVNFTFH